MNERKNKFSGIRCDYNTAPLFRKKDSTKLPRRITSKTKTTIRKFSRIQYIYVLAYTTDNTTKCKAAKGELLLIQNANAPT